MSTILPSCKKISNNFLLFDNTVLHILILFTLVSCLFIFFISGLTENHINEQFLKLIDNNFSSNQLKSFIGSNKTLTNLINSFDKTKTKNLLTNMYSNLTNNENELRISINHEIIYKILMIISSLILISIILIFFQFKIGCFSEQFIHLIVELLIVFSLVGYIEYWFFTNVALKYIPVYNTTMISVFKEKMLKLINETS